MTKIETSEFSYASECAKKSFQAEVSSLHEVVLLLDDKLDKARRNGKSAVFLTMNETEILRQWLMNATVNIHSEYETLDRINRKAMMLCAAAKKIADRCTCQHLIKADRFLEKWQAYKNSKLVEV